MTAAITTRHADHLTRKTVEVLVDGAVVGTATLRGQFSVSRKTDGAIELDNAAIVKAYNRMLRGQ